MPESRTVQWFWVLWEAAQFCVLTRLKTPLGKPQETFTSIEAVLKSLAATVNTQHEEEGEGRKKGELLASLLGLISNLVEHKSFHYALFTQLN